MKKFIVVKNGKEINFGDKILITKSANTPLGITIVRKVAIVTRELMDKLIKDGKVNVVEEKDINKIWNNAIKNLAKKTNWKEEKLYSCGKVAPNLEIKIESADPQNVPGEVLVKGANVFLGYYKNEEATSAVFTKDGWFRTGDMGVIDSDGSLFLKGRSKCMILGPSGQNIYPEEIETVLNSQPYVVDSLVIEDNGGLTALIYPDFRQGETDGMDQDAMVKHFDAALSDINKELPNYAKLKKIEVMSEDFERTPKKSIKRYLYQRS